MSVSKKKTDNADKNRHGSSLTQTQKLVSNTLRASEQKKPFSAGNTQNLQNLMNNLSLLSQKSYQDPSKRTQSVDPRSSAAGQRLQTQSVTSKTTKPSRTSASATRHSVQYERESMSRTIEHERDSLIRLSQGANTDKRSFYGTQSINATFSLGTSSASRGPAKPDSRAQPKPKRPSSSSVRSSTHNRNLTYE